jgi:hypothetical protein
MPYVDPVTAVFMPHQLSGDPAFGEISTTTAVLALGAFAVGTIGAVMWFNRKK